ncbi:hypothetical protein PCIT_a4386 [Pseudoalteromonas citrea]|uniref:Uncharacterized protein n=1 Tax=Pseudoalteromonas citrea TaxID=43655 RepID=A0AAD4FQL1_9GAMM|nr:hypothetical protein PCIT_a4386 [Pseudoalteromonas citrea]
MVISIQKGVVMSNDVVSILTMAKVIQTAVAPVFEPVI